MNVRWIIAASLSLLAYTRPLYAQEVPPDSADSLNRYLQFEDPAPLSCLFTYFPPFFIQNDLTLKEFIRSNEFREIRKRYGDKRAMDAIYVRAMQLTNNNTTIALFLATLATFDHLLVGLKVPVFNLAFALSNESDEEFQLRIRNLPRTLFDDTPPGKYGDRDKLQHFFGSAFLTVLFESPQSAERFGEFVEIEEEKFIVGGVNDIRDLNADRCGQRFGMALLDDNRRFPTEFLKKRLSSLKAISRVDVSCIGVW